MSKVQDVEKWIAEMNANNNSPATVKTRVSSVKGYFDYLILIGVYEGNNPFTGIKTPKVQEYKPDVLYTGEPIPEKNICEHYKRREDCEILPL